MFDNCRGAWSIYRPDPIVLGVMSLLDGKELLISEKESLPALTCGPSQKFSASLEPHKFVSFSEKLNFLELERRKEQHWHKLATPTRPQIANDNRNSNNNIAQRLTVDQLVMRSRLQRD
ncbi:hypothetical protein AVEN_57258-1 [Araneus ventricosus]|uniref:Uncharacterized protein n=1 Tax=Araneus ventricosus TaxID=182803 RepID=A0A4Y2WTD2_ARAVE|nr:hypothetical protein AVEN_57258-1 [Araneus ventricosus]